MEELGKKQKRRRTTETNGGPSFQPYFSKITKGIDDDDDDDDPQPTTPLLMPTSSFILGSISLEMERMKERIKNLFNKKKLTKSLFDKNKPSTR